jgi:hypothetical protein
MNRRGLILAATSALFIPKVVMVAHASASATKSPGPDFFFCDERFAKARRLAAELSGCTALTPVQGDITELWNSYLGRASRQSSLHMRGVTTESFYFCLKIMIGEHARLNAQVTRVDQDLFLWTMRSGLQTATEELHG